MMNLGVIMRTLILLILLIPFKMAFAGETIRLIPAEEIQITPSNNIKKSAPIVLVSCVDHRFPDEIANFMQKRGATDNYSHLIVTGGSIGIDNLLYPSLKESFIIQLALLKQIHNFNTVILLDHRDCELFRLIHGNGHVKSQKEEYKLHKMHLYKARDVVLAEFPDVQVELLLMSTDGSVVTIH